MLALTFSSLVFADCPPVNKVHLVCAHNQFFHACNWQAPWYEGYTENHADLHGQTTVSQFIGAFWGTKDGQATNTGSTICFYQTKDGISVMLGQNSWGNVAKPNANNWHIGFDNQGHAGVVCTANCHFPYGE